jgi:hypothetical protein
LIRVRLFIEVFSGSGRLAAAASAAGFHVLCWDINMGPQYDLLKWSARKVLHRFFLSACAVHFGLPCNTYSLARRGKPGSGMPEPLRSREFPLGLPNLKPVDAQKVQSANLLFKWVASWIRKLLVAHVAVTLENPQTSRVWLVPQMQSLLRHGSRIWFHFCAFGERWRKATAFAVFNFDEILCADTYRCHACKGRCQFTGRKHFNLSGIDPATKRWWSNIGQPYPKKFCNLYAACLTSHCENRAMLVSRELLHNPLYPIFCR